MRYPGRKLYLIPPMLLLALSSFTGMSLAENYYIDASLGDDSWSGQAPGTAAGGLRYS